MIFLRAPLSDKLLLYSHGNAENITLMQQLATLLVASLGVSVLIYEYPGYLQRSQVVSGAGAVRTAAQRHCGTAAAVHCQTFVVVKTNERTHHTNTARSTAS